MIKVEKFKQTKYFNSILQVFKHFFVHTLVKTTETKHFYFIHATSSHVPFVHTKAEINQTKILNIFVNHTIFPTMYLFTMFTHFFVHHPHISFMHTFCNYNCINLSCFWSSKILLNFWIRHCKHDTDSLIMQFSRLNKYQYLSPRSIHMGNILLSQDFSVISASTKI